MNIITIVLTALVAIEHPYIMYLETIATDSTMTSRTLGLPRETPRDKNIANIVENQEAHNALLAVLIFVALCVQDLFWLRLLLWFIISVASIRQAHKQS